MTDARDDSDRLDGIDHVDMGILHLLQQDARNNTISMIGERVEVSSSTVGNRIRKLEEHNIITGYHPTVNYEKAGFDHRLLVTGTVPFEELESTASEILDVSGVVNVRELLTNENNVIIEVVGSHRSAMKQSLLSLGKVGVKIDEISIVNQGRTQPFDEFGKQFTDRGTE